ncbi:hypothetical protein NSK_005445 [Nannochloropsis salina CCMP1776]|uniref:Uncharacterized protein n=1 Tax=Nannochloropsis salina CCMP1776 TaxID=1027361 RepID=A0A4D9CXT5_9STRA|nr:hypothetical protein NSK_005445 [Nannochloropsis salina CCMP1776]|eukprot:TFJ83284.1 hypothetical protein NSK_005445 [Nannochloropsis salina CCMP1776]
MVLSGLGVHTSVVSGKFAYFGTYTQPGQVVKVSLTDFIIVDRLFLEALDDDAEDALVSSVLSGAFAYFGTDTFPGIVVKVAI